MSSTNPQVRGMTESSMYGELPDKMENLPVALPAMIIFFSAFQHKACRLTIVELVGLSGMAHSLSQNVFGIKRVSERYLVSSLHRDGQPLK